MHYVIPLREGLYKHNYDTEAIVPQLASYCSSVDYP